MNQEDRAVQLAIQLKRLNVSQAGIVDLLSHYSHDVIERQLQFLPFRKAKRKEAFIVDAIRNDYSPPKEFYYASPQPPAPSDDFPLDQDPKPAVRHAPAEPLGHGAQGAPGADPGQGTYPQPECIQARHLTASEADRFGKRRATLQRKELKETTAGGAVITTS